MSWSQDLIHKFRLWLTGENTLAPVVQLGSSDGTALGVDEVTGALIGIDYAHHEIHEGKTFEAGYRSPDGANVADNGNITILLRVPAGIIAHMIASGYAGGDAEPILHESPTVTNAGTPITPHNKDRSSANTAQVTAFHTPTVNLGVGTELLDGLLVGGTGGATLGGVQEVRNEWLMAPSTDYVLRLINRSGTAQPLSIQAEWYEKTVT